VRTRTVVGKGKMNNTLRVINNRYDVGSKALLKLLIFTFTSGYNSAESIEIG